MTPSADNKGSPVEEETLLTAKRFRVQRVKHVTEHGVERQREVIRHPGSVVIVPCVDDSHVCLIRNFRMAAGRALIELPAGTLEGGEPPLECARRELIEETGYRATDIQPLTAFFAAPGILDEFMHLFVATGLSIGAPAREADEDIENVIVSWDHALKLVERGDICDAKTISGLLFYHHFRREAR